MTSEGINRQPQGIPTGGQFAANNHAEAPIKLFDRTDGSFLKPAPSATAEHCIEFWSNVEIPDEIITQVETEYMKVRSAEIDSDMEDAMGQWRSRWEAENPVPKDRYLAEYQERFKQEYEQHRRAILPSVEAKRPPALGEYDSRQLIRATQMLIHRPVARRFPGEGDKVLLEPIELFDETLAVYDIEQKYRLSAVRYAMSKVFQSESEMALLRAIEGQSEKLSGIHEQLVHQRADFSEY